VDNLISLLITLLFLVPACNKLRLLLSPAVNAHPSHYPTRALQIQAYTAETAKTAFYCAFAVVFAWPIMPIPVAIQQSSFSDLLVPFAALSGAIGALLSYRIQPHAPNQTARTPREWIEYSESKDDPETLADRRGLTGMRTELLALGFVPTDLLTARTKMLRKAVTESVEVFAERTAFAAPGLFDRYHTLSFRTRLEDGTIVETTLLVPAKKVNWLLDAVRRTWIRVRWARRLRPRAGYWVQIVHSSPASAWQRHRHRVGQLARMNLTAVPAHSQSSFYTGIARDSFEIAALGTLADILALILPLPTIGVSAMLLIRVWIGHSELSSWQWIILGLILLLAEVVALWLSRRLSRSQLRELGRLFGYCH
jgi:hypothetical protein